MTQETRRVSIISYIAFFRCFILRKNTISKVLKPIYEELRSQQNSNKDKLVVAGVYLDGEADIKNNKEEVHNCCEKMHESTGTQR